MVFLLRDTAEHTASSVPDFVLSAHDIAATLMHGGHHRRAVGTGEKFWQFRPYTQDDDTRHIDWRQSARQESVYIRQKELQTQQNFLFWCCGAQSMRFHSSPDIPQKIHAAQTILFSLALVFAHMQNAIGPLGARASGYHEPALSALQSALEVNEDTLPENASLSSARKNHVFLAGDFLSPIDDIAQRFERLAAQTRHGVIFHIVDPAERFLPYSGRVQFQGSDQDSPLDIDHVDDIRGDYIAKMQAHADSLRTLCEQHGWHYFMHETDTPVLDTLLLVMDVLSAGTTR